jgi:hypothetical protein
VKRLLAWLLASLAFGAQAQALMVLDDFTDTRAWQAAASDEVQARMARAPGGAGLCLRYDFGRVSGYAVLRRALPLEMPPQYALVLRLSGRGPANALQLKLVDASGDNVWWMNLPGYRPPATASDLLVRQRQIEFAWGPTADRVLKRAAAIELVVASGEGGRGELCFERLSLRPLPAPAPPAAPVASASAGEAALAVDGNPATAWQAGPGAQRWGLDLGSPRELNGLVLRWADGAPARSFELQFSGNGRHWRSVRRVQHNQRSTQALWLPGSETRYLRLRLPRGSHSALAEVQLMSPEQWPKLNSMLGELARAGPRGRMPRAFNGEQNYWTLVGVDGGGAHAALVSEDGAIEPRKGGPSLEPFVIDEAGRPHGWADVQAAQSLRDGYLPMPQVHWAGQGFTLDLEAGADGPADAPQLVARYRVANTGAQRRTLTLALALRPWQVNPPTQFLNTQGGAAELRRVAWRRGTLQVDGGVWLRSLTAEPTVQAMPFGDGDPLESGRGQASADDAQSLATAVLRWPLELAPGESRSVDVVLPLATNSAPDTRTAEQRLDTIAAGWRERLNRSTLTLPGEAQPIVDTVRTSLAHILMSRNGPALQPGTRSYARSWVRDGAMMVAGLLRLGELDAAREFVQWYAGHLFDNGKVPCCVDARGADPVAENDSHGEFIFAVAELWRYTRDTALVAPLWPRVDAAARYMEGLRQSERTPAHRPPLFGMMPASISHEGYSAKPMHSYWDNFWALAGWRDATLLAQALGHTQRAAELAAQRDEFRHDLAASLQAAVALHRIDYLPGAAELGDFDPSSSTLIFSPAGAEHSVPRELLEATWARYWRESVQRRDGTREWADYTPYELRSVSALLRLGQPERAHEMLRFFLNDRRPAAWNQWAEVVGRLPREPRFVGDMPHAWISSDYLRAALDLLAYERESDDALVLAAGVPEAWWRAGPVAVQGLRTAHGVLGYRLEMDAAAAEVRFTLAPGLREPPGGLWLAWRGSLVRVDAGGAAVGLPLR